MGFNPYQTGAGGGLNPGYSGQDLMAYNAGRDRRIQEQKEREAGEARMRAKALGTGRPSADPSRPAGGQAGTTSGNDGGGLLEICLLGLFIGVLIVGIATVPLAFAMSIFAWPVPSIIRRTAFREWRIGPGRSWLVMFLGLWVMLTLAVFVGGVCWYYTAQTYRVLPDVLEALARPLGWLIEMVRSNLEAGALPWNGLNRIPAGYWVAAVATVGVPLHLAFAATLMFLERPKFNSMAGFGRAVATGLLGLIAGVVGLGISLAALGLAVVQIYG